jgi:type IV secretion system protein VirD4
MANERALGISFMWAAQAWPQLSAIFGEQEARTLVGLTNNLIVFGGSKDVAFNREISDLLGQVRISRTSWQSGKMGGRQVSADDISILTPAEVRQLKERHALVLSENGAPIIARLRRCIDGKQGRQLMEDQARLRTLQCPPIANMPVAPEARATAALIEARRRGCCETTRTSRDRPNPASLESQSHGRSLQPFPSPGRRVEHAYRELDVALYGSDEDKKALGAPTTACPPVGSADVRRP